jgi:hypothetical protein
LSWSEEFDAPIMLDDGRELITLLDAGKYVTALPKKEQAKPHWRTAAGELLTAAERGGIVMMAELAMCQVLAHGRPNPAPAPRKKLTKQYKIIR